MVTKYTIEDVEKSFIKEGYTLLSTVYKNSLTKLQYVCPKGHKHQITFKKWQAGQRCPICMGKLTYSLNNIQHILFKEGYILLSDKYEDTNTVLEYICPNGHKHTTTFKNWKKGRRCPHCSNKIKKEYEDVKKSFEIEGYVLLSTNYLNCESKLMYKCPNGHIRETTWSVWRKGYRCPECSGKAKLCIDYVTDIISKEGYTILDTVYHNNHQNLNLVCPNGHNYSVSYANWRSKSYRCPKCSEWGVSKSEKDLVSFIASVYSGNIETNDRQLLVSKELDVLLPDLKLAVEYCGIYWHSELAGKARNYHLNKLKECENLGYTLLTVFEDEWLNKNDITKSRISSYINSSNMTSLYARKCIIKEISAKEAKTFCEANHLQGYGSGASIKLGAFFEGVLVAVMTFSRPSLAKGYKIAEDSYWELHRFCTLINYRVVGVASKLLSFFERNFTCTTLFSFADRRWSTGNLYEQLGFTLSYTTSPNYWYFKGSNPKRINRFSLRKGMLEDDPQLSEWENRKLQGYNRIWDCGNLKYVKEYK